MKPDIMQLGLFVLPLYIRLEQKNRASTSARAPQLDATAPLVYSCCSQLLPLLDAGCITDCR